MSVKAVWVATKPEVWSASGFKSWALQVRTCYCCLRLNCHHCLRISTVQSTMTKYLLFTLNCSQTFFFFLFCFVLKNWLSCIWMPEASFICQISACWPSGLSHLQCADTQQSVSNSHTSTDTHMPSLKGLNDSLFPTATLPLTRTCPLWKVWMTVCFQQPHFY